VVERYARKLAPLTNDVRSKKMRHLCILAVCFAVVGCSGHRDLTEYSLDETSFDSEAMAKIQTESGITLPDGSKGLAFKHIPPIDAIVFAKIQIPGDAQESLTKQIEALKTIEFPNNFAYDRCAWWPPSPEHIVLTKRAFSNRYYVELHLVKEGEVLVLYIQYFTI
jgi:hypothetical protein